MSEPEDHPPSNSRRFALGRIALATGGVVCAAAAVGPLGVALSPLVRPDGVGSSDGWLRVDTVQRFAVGAPPARVVLRRDVRDQWLVRRGETIGAVLVERVADTDFRVLSSVCPHLGCSVVWQADAAPQPAAAAPGGRWLCPCHKSTFARDGGLIPSESGPPNPSPRPLDPLEWRIADANLEVRWVRFQTGIAERVPVGGS